MLIEKEILMGRLLSSITLVTAWLALAAASTAEDAKPDTLQTWQEMKYGMFIHFGMSTFTGREIDAGDMPSTTYAPAHPDVDQWIRVARDAGMKYTVLTSKHVAGHCLWDSKVKFRGKEFDYDVATSGNTTDIISEYVKVCGKYGIMPGIYWCMLDFHNNSVQHDKQWTAGSLPDDFFQLAQDQLTELIQRYPALAYYWIDIPRSASAEQRRVLYDLIKRLRPDTVVMFNFGTESQGMQGLTIESTQGISWPTDVLNSERFPISVPFNPDQVWQGKHYRLGYEHCDCIGREWFWVEGDKPRPTSELCRLYHKTVAAGGNLLLDVPPDRSGRIPDYSVNALMELKRAIDDPVVAKMQGLFPQFDADHNGVLDTGEQARAVDFVRSTYGGQWALRIQRMLDLASAPDKSVSAAAWNMQVAVDGGQAAVQTVMIPMRDGKKLATDLYLPAGDGPFPVVLSRTPYGRVKNKDGAEGFVSNGAAWVVQDMRGRFESEGENMPFVGCGWAGHQDGVDTIEWLKKQPWCDGRFATIGGSACGITQNLLAGAAPAGLKAQYISVAAASLYPDVSYTGGALRKADVENWTTENKFDPSALATIRAHPSYDDYWRTFDTTLKFSQMNVPAVHIGGWFDMFAQGTIDEFTGRQHSGAEGSRGTQKLIMGPWTHGIGKMPAGELTFPNATKVPTEYNAARWFDHWVRGTNNGVEKEPAVSYYVMGDTSTPNAPGNEWRHAYDWPVPAKETAAYFSADHKLTFDQPPTSGDAHVEYTFDPANPCPSIGGGNLTIPRGPMNQNKIENRNDVLLFTTEPLTEPVEVTGRVKARVFIASSAADTDLSVRLCDVYPDGKSYLMAEGMLRLRYRKSLEKPVPLVSDAVEEVTVDCWSTSIIFNKGHRIRATITSGNYPRFDVNPGTGQPWTDAGPKEKQTNRIFCDAAHASCLLLPLVAK